MTRQALLLLVVFCGQPILTHQALAAPASADAATAGGLFGTAVSVAMGAQSSIAMLGRSRPETLVAYRHPLPHRRGRGKSAGVTQPPAGVSFADDVAPTEAAAAPAQSVTPQDLAAALSSR